MIRITWIPQPEKKEEKIPSDSRMLIIDCGRARERTKGLGGNSLENGFPPFNHSFP